MRRQSMRMLLFSFLSAATLFGVACGDDSPSNGGASGEGDSVTSITGSADIGTLSASDKTALCDDVNRYASAALPGSRDKICTIVGSVIASGEAWETNELAQNSCVRKRDECLENDDTFIDDDCLEDVTATCSATVSEYTACVKARTDQVKAIFDKIRTCPDLNLDYLASNFTADFTQLPSECNIIKTVCPGALDDGDIFDNDLYEEFEIFN